MTFKPRLWEPIAWIVTGINIVGAYFAAGASETWHAGAHALFAAVFALWAQRLRRVGRQATGDASVAERIEELESRLAALDALPDVEGRLAELEERVDFAERALVEVRARPQIPPKS
jgi:uncharacterized coiled-coil protein SlyX